jgi:hypothetical protein
MVRTGLELVTEIDVLMDVGIKGLWWSESLTDTKCMEEGRGHESVSARG